MDGNILTSGVFLDSTSAGGFSFLVSDGLHQIGPEWFTVESSERISVAIEANARLVIPPGNTPSVIGMDLLRAHIPNVSYYLNHLKCNK